MNWEKAMKAAESAAAFAKGIGDRAQELASTEFKVCNHCLKTTKYSRAAVEMGLMQYDLCRVCATLNCTECLQVSGLPIPPDMWNHSQKQPSNGRAMACPVCRDMITKRAINEFVTCFIDDFDENVRVFLEDGDGSKDWVKPGACEDTHSRRAFRAAKFANIVIDFVPIGTLTVKAIRFALYGSQIMQMIVPEDISVILSPVMEGIQAFGVKGPEGILRLYYLGCHHELMRRLHPETAYSNRELGDVGVMSPNCSWELLDLVGAYAGPAMWMYNCQLPSPKNTNDWTCWFLSRIVAVDNWTLLAAISETTKLPDGKYSPAFCLVARRSPTKEAMLVIRGSTTSGCWAINAKYTCIDFTYQSIKRGPVETKVHMGMYDATTSILQSYDMWRHLVVLAKEGFIIRLVGHSMGGATAAVIAAELVNRFTHMVKSDQISSLPSIKAICYGTPPCVSADLSSALFDDELVVTVVNQDDFVPRLCRHTLLQLVDQIKEIETVSKTWRDSDLEHMRLYTANLGLTGLTNEVSKPAVIQQNQEGETVENREEMEITELKGTGDSTKEKISVELEKQSSDEAKDADWTNDVLVVPGVIINIFERNGKFSIGVIVSPKPLHL